MSFCKNGCVETATAKTLLIKTVTASVRINISLARSIELLITSESVASYGSQGQVSYEGIAEYPELEGSHRDH